MAKGKGKRKGKKTITAKQRSARRKNMAIARKSRWQKTIARGMRSSPKLGKAALKHIVKKGSPGNIRTAQAAYRLSTGRYTSRRSIFNPKFG